MVYYTAQLRIEGKSLDPAQVARHLGMAPTLSRQVGERRDATSVWDKALWAFDAQHHDELEWDSLDAALRALLKIFIPHKETLHRYKLENDVYLYCGQFSVGRGGGPVLSPEILAALGDFGIPLHLCAYFSDAES